MNKKKCMILALAVLPMLNSCSDWLDPKPLSFYSPENTYVDAAGLYAALTACERNMRHEFFGDGAPILTEMYLTDIAVHGKTDESGSLVDLDNEMLPSRTKNDMKGKNKWYWEEGFKGIKYANIAISRLDGAEYKDEAERNAVLGAAYFQRAYRYYKLTHQFGVDPRADRAGDGRARRRGRTRRKRGRPAHPTALRVPARHGRRRRPVDATARRPNGA